MPSDYEIVITRPCIDTPGRYIAESAFGRRLDMDAVCALARAIADAKCSASLGVARFDLGGHTVILYRSGRVDLRKVRDAADAREAMGELERLLAGAFEQEHSVHQDVKT